MGISSDLHEHETLADATAGKGGAADFWQAQIALAGRVERDWPSIERG
jgi:hypothetical protein